MKKHIAIVIFISLLFSIISCQSNIKNTDNSNTAETDGFKETDIYQSLITDVANDGLGGRIDVNYWTGEFFKKEQMLDKTFTVLGNEYVCQYKNSIIERPNFYTTDNYEDENDMEFGVRSDTGELVYLNLSNKEFFDTEPYLPDIENPKEFAISFAVEIASQYVDDLSDYTQILEDPQTTYTEKDGQTYELTYYFITFAKKVSGYWSSDYLSVKVSSKGHLVAVKMGDINAFENVSVTVDSELVDESLTKKVAATYEGKSLDVKTSSAKSQYIVIAPDGNICILSDVYVTFTSDEKTLMAIATVVGKAK